MSKGDDQVWYAQNKGRMAMGRLVLEASTGVHGEIAKKLALELSAALAAPPVEQPEAPPRVSEADITAAREHIADVHNAEQLRSALGQLRREVVIELAARGFVPSFYGTAQAEQPAPQAGAAEMDWSVEGMKPIEGLDYIMRDYARTFGRTPDAFMTEIVAKTKQRLFLWWGKHREVIREALAAHPAEQPIQDASHV